MREPTTEELTKDMIDALGKAGNAAGQLIHTHGSPAFFMIRRSIEVTKDGVSKWAMREYDKKVFHASIIK